MSDRGYVANVFRTRRLLLRGFEPDDAAAFFAVLSNPLAMAPWGGPYDEQRAKRELADYLAHQRRYGFAPFAVMLDDQLIGDVGLQHLEDGANVELLYPFFLMLGAKDWPPKPLTQRSVTDSRPSDSNTSWR